MSKLLTFALVGFYAGLNLIAWFMIFCFVRETKQLTLEELDRKSNLEYHDQSYTNVYFRGVLGADQDIHSL